MFQIKKKDVKLWGVKNYVTRVCQIYKKVQMQCLYVGKKSHDYYVKLWELQIMLGSVKNIKVQGCHVFQFFQDHNLL